MQNSRFDDEISQDSAYNPINEKASRFNPALTIQYINASNNLVMKK